MTPVPDVRSAYKLEFKACSVLKSQDSEGSIFAFTQQLFDTTGSERELLKRYMKLHSCVVSA